MAVNNYFVCVNNRHEFYVTRQVGDPLPKTCPECGDEINQVWHKAPDSIVQQDAKTLGVLADRNRKKMGRSLIEAKEYERKQRQEKGKEVAREELLAKLPNGASLPERPKGNPWFRSNISKPLTGLNKYTPEEKTKYLMTGKEIPGKPVDSTS